MQKVVCHVDREALGEVEKAERLYGFVTYLPSKDTVRLITENA